MLKKLRNVTYAIASFMVTLPGYAEISQGPEIHHRMDGVYEWFRPVAYKARIEREFMLAGLTTLATQNDKGDPQWLIVNGTNWVGVLDFVGVENDTGNSSVVLRGHDGKVLFSAREIYRDACRETAIRSDLIVEPVINGQSINHETRPRYRIGSSQCRSGFFAIYHQEANRFIWEGEVNTILVRAIKVLTATQGSGLVLPLASRLELSLGHDKYLLQHVHIAENDSGIVISGFVPSTSAYSIVLRHLMSITDLPITDRLAIRTW